MARVEALGGFVGETAELFVHLLGGLGVHALDLFSDRHALGLVAGLGRLLLAHDIGLLGLASAIHLAVGGGLAVGEPGLGGLVGAAFPGPGLALGAVHGLLHVLALAAHIDQGPILGLVHRFLVDAGLFERFVRVVGKLGGVERAVGNLGRGGRGEIRGRGLGRWLGLGLGYRSGHLLGWGPAR